VAKARPIKRDNAVGIAELLKEPAGEPVVEGRSVAVEQHNRGSRRPAVHVMERDAVYFDRVAPRRIGSFDALCFGSVEQRSTSKCQGACSQSNLGL